MIYVDYKRGSGAHLNIHKDAMLPVKGWLL